MNRSISYMVGPDPTINTSSSVRFMAPVEPSPILGDFCTWLGSDVDRVTHYGFPTVGNLCCSPVPHPPIGEGHQAQYCLGGPCLLCLYYFDSRRDILPAEPPAALKVPPVHRWRRAGMCVAGVLFGISLLSFILWAIL